MTTNQLCRWLVSALAIGVIGCSKSTPTEPVAVAPAIVVPTIEDEDSKASRLAEPTQPTKPAAPLVTLPDDRGGKAVANALLNPTPLPIDVPTAHKPKPYSSTLDRGEVPLPPVGMKPFPPAEPKDSITKPSPPQERHWPGSTTTVLPEGRVNDRPRVKAPALSNPGAADVPISAWRQGDRASLNDPTVDLSAMRVIETLLPTTMPTLPFLRTSIPNPFEFSEQLRGKLGKEPELGTIPVK